MIESRIIVALLNAAWQSALIVSCAIALLRLVRGASASARCAVWTLAFVVSALLPIVDFVRATTVQEPVRAAGQVWQASSDPIYLIVRPFAYRSALAKSVVYQPHSRASGTQTHGSHSPTDRTPEAAPLSTSVISFVASPQRLALRTLLARAVNRASNVLFWMWIAGAGLLGLRLLLQLGSLAHAKRHAALFQQATLLEIPNSKRAYRIGLSDAVHIPCLLGLTQPLIAIPAGLAAALSPADLKRIVLHETAHLGRYDDWVNLFEQVALSVFFLNPALHYIARRTALEREIACDDQVVASEDRLFYAECLSTLARHTRLDAAFATPGFAASKRQLLMRIERVLDRTHNGSASVGRLPYVATGIMSALVVWLSQSGLPVMASSSPSLPTTTQTIRLVIHAHRSAQAHIVRQTHLSHQLRSTAISSVTKLAPPSTPPSRRALPARGGSRSAQAASAAAISKSGAVLYVEGAATRSPVTIALAQSAAADVTAERASSATNPQYTISSEPYTLSAVDQSAAPGTTAKGYVFIFYGPHDVETLRAHDVTDAYIKALRAAGYQVISVQDLAALRDHDVSAAYAQAMNSLAGIKASVKTLIELRDHDVSAQYAQGMKQLLHSQADLRALSVLHDHDVSAELAKAMAELNKNALDVRALTKLSDHGVSADYLRAMSRLVPSVRQSISFDELAKLCDHGVTPEYIESLKRVGYANLPTRDIVRLYDHGVTAGFIERARRAHNNALLSVDDLVRMADEGF